MKSNKPVRVIITGEAKKAFQRLNEISGLQLRSGKINSPEIQLINSIKEKISFIKQNPFYGENIKKELIPKKYTVPNLWRLELTNYWRALYTIKGDEVEIVCFVLEIVDHPAYNKILGYRKK